jgi:hypothetical protein
MIRVLALASLFPDASRPVFGPFVERQTLALAAHPDVELQIVAPLIFAPFQTKKNGKASRSIGHAFTIFQRLRGGMMLGVWSVRCSRCSRRYERHFDLT